MCFFRNNASNDKITVIFHILVPSKLVERNRRVLIRTNLYELGGWESMENTLKVVR